MTSPISTAPSQGLASLDMFASSSLTPAPAPASASQPAAQRTTTTSQQDDLLGLF
ncbi:hypothetical protein FRC14_000217 [Serendipita sp. 396]|nr:hypothetical protein FRC14_000217 [Serendipita sp. 396]KAG8776849.1 hypothetical protein FRC15_011671 [Serendipita sp. 397]KAG8824560.1 hypothetical protein FRC18_010492 [Serendipita sp. 400]